MRVPGRALLASPLAITVAAGCRPTGGRTERIVRVQANKRPSVAPPVRATKPERIAILFGAAVAPLCGGMKFPREGEIFSFIINKEELFRFDRIQLCRLSCRRFLKMC